MNGRDFTRPHPYLKSNRESVAAEGGRTNFLRDKLPDRSAYPRRLSLSMHTHTEATLNGLRGGKDRGKEGRRKRERITKDELMNLRGRESEEVLEGRMGRNDINAHIGISKNTLKFFDSSLLDSGSIQVVPRCLALYWGRRQLAPSQISVW